MEIGQLISDFGFPIVMAVVMGYLIYYVWAFIETQVKPELGKMHTALIKVIDQTRMLDQDMIRLQQKVNVVLEYKATQEILRDAKEKEALAKVEAEKKEDEN